MFPIIELLAGVIAPDLVVQQDSDVGDTSPSSCNALGANMSSAFVLPAMVITDLVVQDSDVGG